MYIISANLVILAVDADILSLSVGTHVQIYDCFDRMNSFMLRFLFFACLLHNNRRIA